MKRFSIPKSSLSLPAVLSGLFVAQNQFFNSAAHLSPNPYLFQFFFTTFFLGMLLYGPAVFFKKKIRDLYLFVMGAVITLIFTAQYLYFSYFGGFMQASVVKYLNQAGAVKSTIFSLLTPLLVVFLLQFFVVFAWIQMEKNGKIKPITLLKNEKIRLGFYLVAIGFFSYSLVLFGSANGWKKITNLPQTIREMNSFVYSPNDTVARTGIFNYYAGDTIGYLFRKTTLTDEDRVLVETWREEKPEAVKNKYFGSAQGKNLIIVQFESLENVVLFQKINGQEITPNLNKLAKEGLYFNHYYTQVGPGNTADAEFVTLNSLYPLPNTVAFIDFAHNKYSALPSLLKENGYHTYSLHSDVPTFWNRSNIYPALGYETIFSKSSFSIPDNSGFENLSDGDFFAQSLEKMENFESPFMATLITLSSHTPFFIPKKSQTLVFSENDLYTETQKNYLQSIHYSDDALGQFIAGLKKNGKYDNSLIAIYGDHGALTDIGNVMGTSTSTVFPELRSSIEGSVPLIILGSSLSAKTYNVYGSHLDFYPTIANLLGISPSSALFGQDLLGNMHRVTIRNSYSRSIMAILEEKTAYKNFTDGGIFETGECLRMPTQKTIPLSNCEKMYEEELNATNASDLIVRGNLVPSLSSAK